MANIKEELKEYLAQEGLRPQEEDFGLFFRYQMINFLILTDSDDENFLRICIPSIFDVDENNKIDVLTVCNQVNLGRKVVKCICTDDNSVWVTTEQLLDQTPVYSDIVPRSIEMLLEARSGFYEGLRNL